MPDHRALVPGRQPPAFTSSCPALREHHGTQAEARILGLAAKHREAGHDAGRAMLGEADCVGLPRKPSQLLGP